MSLTKIAVLFVCYELCGLCANVSSGLLLNHTGYRRVFLWALFLHALASLGYVAVLWWPPGIALLVWVGVLRAMRGVAKELLKTTSAAYIKKLQTDHMQCHWLLGGKDSAKGIGLLVGGVMLTWLGFVMSFLVLTVLSIVCWLWAYHTIDDMRERRVVSFRQFGKVETRMRWLALGRAFLYAGRDLWLVLALPVYLSSIGVSKVVVGGMLAAGLVAFGLVQPLSGWWVRRRLQWGEKTLKAPWLYERVLSLSCLLLALIPLLMLWYSHHLLAAVLLIVSYNILSGLATAPHNDLQVRFAQEERAAVDIAYYKTIAQVGKVAAVFASGWLFQYWGIAGCLWASFGCLVISGLIGLWVSYLTQQTPQAKRFFEKYVSAAQKPSMQIQV